MLFVSYTYPPFMETGGPPLKVSAMAEGLVERGWEVTVLTQNHARPSVRIEEVRNGVRVVYLRELFRYRFVPFPVGVGAFLRKHRANFDIIHIFGTYDVVSPRVARWAGLAGVPYFVEPMGMHRAIVRSRLKKRLYHAVFGHRVIDAAESVIATSDVERDELTDDGVAAGQILLRRNGIDLHPFQGVPSPEKIQAFRDRWSIARGPITVFLGRLAAKKHPEMLLDAFAQARAPGVVVFIGPDEDGMAARLRGRASEIGIDDRLVITGPIYDVTEKVIALQAADLFVLPSESENFGNSVLEAMMANTPVIMTDRCGVASLVGPGEGIVVPFDLEALVAAITTVLADAATAGELVRGGRALAERMDWSAPLRETEAMYETAIEGGQ